MRLLSGSLAVYLSLNLLLSFSLHASDKDREDAGPAGRSSVKQHITLSEREMAQLVHIMRNGNSSEEIARFTRSIKEKAVAEGRVSYKASEPSGEEGKSYTSASPMRMSSLPTLNERVTKQTAVEDCENLFMYSRVGRLMHQNPARISSEENVRYFEDLCAGLEEYVRRYGVLFAGAEFQSESAWDEPSKSAAAYLNHAYVLLDDSLVGLIGAIDGTARQVEIIDIFRKRKQYAQEFASRLRMCPVSLDGPLLSKAHDYLARACMDVFVHGDSQDKRESVRVVKELLRQKGRGALSQDVKAHIMREQEEHLRQAKLNVRVGTASGKIRERYARLIGKRREESFAAVLLAAEAADNHTDTIVQVKIRSLGDYVVRKPEGWLKKGLEIVADLEERVRASIRYDRVNEDSSVSLFDVYSALTARFQERETLNFVNQILYFFISENDWKGARERFEAFHEVLQASGYYDNVLTRELEYLRSVFAAHNGEVEALDHLQQENERRRVALAGGQKKAKRRAQKAKKQQQLVRALVHQKEVRGAQDLQDVQPDIKSSEEVSVPPTKPSLQPVKRVLTPQEVAAEQANQQRLKEEKLRRHQEAEAQRVREAGAAAPASAGTRAAPTRVQELQRESTLGHLTIQDVFELPTGSLKIDNAINSGEWRGLTRAHIIEYFRDLGCEVSSGAGDHMNIRIDFKGKRVGHLAALLSLLTLGDDWDNNGPADYLKKQILEMRQMVLRIQQAD